MRIEPGAEPIVGYKLIDRIGGGGFGEVWKAEAPGGLLKAIKVVYGDLHTTDADGTRRAEQELKALRRVQSVRHPYLLSLERYDIIEGRLLIVMELADRNLWERWRECKSQGLSGIPREELLRYMEESAEVLDLMNGEYQLQHLDIKPQNLFLVRNHAKVADFGLVKDLEGMMATVTGGITPVYAAPETFDGKVSRFCDQYSLAIVYQELLTGQRPFSGTSLQQLIMQHLSAAPNLTPLPKADRAAIARGLSKKPEGRFPTCTELVQALRNATIVEAAKVSVSAPTPSAGVAPIAPPLVPAPAAERTPHPETPLPKDLGADATSAPKAEAHQPILGDKEPADDASAPARQAPPKQTGDGFLYPAVVIGLGQKGMEVLQQLRESLTDTFGSMHALPHLRLLYIDTDPDTMQAACRGSQGTALTSGETFLARLNRPSHYFKAVGGKVGIDWFNQKFIYRIPRNPATTGMRCLGRLAYVDHFKPLAAKVQAELEACVKPDALATANKQTKLGVRSNYPRVYVVTSLTGGSGSGMFIDLAYLVRAQLHRLGYAEADVVGLLLLPILDPQRGNVLALGNAHAALTELNYFSAPETTFSVRYDDRDGRIKDKDPPFNRSVLLPLEPEHAKNQAGEGARLAGDFLFRELITPLGRMADTCRPAEAPVEGSVKASFQTLGLFRFSWPRRALIQRTARRLCAQLVEHWQEKDPAPVRDGVKKWINQELTRQGLEAENLIGLLQDACEKELGQAPETTFNELTEPFVPRGKRSPDPEPEAVREVLGQLEELVGTSDVETTPVHRDPPLLDTTMEKACAPIVKKWGGRMAQLAASLVEDPDYRMCGAEEAVRRLTALVEGTLESHEPVMHDLEREAKETYRRIQEMLDILEANPGGGRRTAAVVADLSEALREYPRCRYQSLILRHMATVFVAIRGKLSDQVRELTFVRQRLAELQRALDAPVADDPAGAVPVPGAFLLPEGCESLDEAVDGVLGDITAEDARGLEQSIQEIINQQFASLVQVCLTSANIVRSLEEAMVNLAEAFLASRLTKTNVVEMFLAQHGDDEEAAGQEIVNAYQEAVPELARRIKCPEPEVRILALPPGPPADRFRILARKALTSIPLAFTDSIGDIVVYREQPAVPVEQLELLGPAGRNAYQQMMRSENFTPHSREDITDWQVKKGE